MNKISSSFLTVLSFISIIPIPKKFFHEWNNENLRFFCIMIPFVGIIFGFSWPLFGYLLTFLNFSETFKGFIMTLLTLSLTGGLHMDGLMDSFDALFSHRDRETRLKILSDSHSGSFAVMICVIVFMLKTFLFAEIFSRGVKLFTLSLIPIYSRFGMGLMLNNLPFAKSDGLALTLGSSRNSKDNILFLILFVILLSFDFNLIPFMFVMVLLIWSGLCLKIFGGITGDLIGAFNEISEIFMLIGVVIEDCI